jgi:hypothetical protein
MGQRADRDVVGFLDQFPQEGARICLIVIRNFNETPGPTDDQLIARTSSGLTDICALSDDELAN